ncbi:hypothetical protein HMN09_01254600 [Mycena chlorophos]|uniref:Uncharacterized protein n=1 Tax=Mycena chlorophos TaxID=658473 RepID=A0A8H6S2C4_MYCCL|nr:hypothetical protein HMN09_01254600 [Mycena chlorophos]
MFHSAFRLALVAGLLASAAALPMIGGGNYAAVNANTNANANANTNANANVNGSANVQGTVVPVPTSPQNGGPIIQPAPIVQQGTAATTALNTAATFVVADGQNIVSQIVANVATLLPIVTGDVQATSNQVQTAVIQLQTLLPQVTETSTQLNSALMALEAQALRGQISPLYRSPLSVLSGPFAVASANLQASGNTQPATWANALSTTFAGWAH